MIFTVLCVSLYCVIYDLLCCAVMRCAVMRCAVMCYAVMYCALNRVQCGGRVVRCMIEFGMKDG